MKNKYYILLCIIILLFSCSQVTVKKKNTSQIENSIIETQDWKQAFDFNGDGLNDTIIYDYTGGAHCCYLISIKLSNNDAIFHFPFEIDGGYLFFDLSIPEKFFIKDYDNDNLPEIYINFNSYNDHPEPLSIEIKKKYNINTNKILIDYKDKSFRVIDYEITNPVESIKKTVGK